MSPMTPQEDSEEDKKTKRFGDIVAKFISSTTLHGIPHISDTSKFYNVFFWKNVIWSLCVAAGCAMAAGFFPQLAPEYYRLRYRRMSPDERWARSHNLDEMMVGCKFGNKDIAHFKRLVHHRKGRRKRNPTTKTGEEYGLQLLLDVQQDLYMPYTEATGVRIILHSPEVAVFREDTGFKVPTGFECTAPIKRLDMLPSQAEYPISMDENQKVTRPTRPHGGCEVISDSDNKQMNALAQDYGYSALACSKTCLQRNILTKCHCCTPEVPCPSSLTTLVFGTNQSEETMPPICGRESNVTMNFCSIQVKGNFFSDQLGCTEMCPELCEEMFYGTNPSFAVWPGKAYHSTIVEKLKITHGAALTKQELNSIVEDSLLKVDIFYPSFEYQQFTISPKYDWSVLLSNIGGSVSLWLGFSLLTALELAELILDSVLFVFSKVFMPRKSQINPR
ncbi:amiloride-sensitive sodium channel subunit gamma-2-like [Aplysia californica]|uniref:Amiloride-sensitive sodium channel subunit gamma-2-like n=1 Tax=Aplysia californica TaxID=6500 RepID=A0ABM1VYJ4_APLCA|nr:amiloride-sensitive sodium channel subunit gamma-2-like [Aplysia californica]